MNALDIISDAARDAGVMPSQARILSDAIAETAAGLNARALYLDSQVDAEANLDRTNLRRQAAAQHLQSEALNDLAKQVSDPANLAARISEMHRSGRLRDAVGNRADDLLKALVGNE